MVDEDDLPIKVETSASKLYRVYDKTQNLCGIARPALYLLPGSKRSS